MRNEHAELMKRLVARTIAGDEDCRDAAEAICSLGVDVAEAEGVIEFYSLPENYEPNAEGPAIGIHFVNGRIPDYDIGHRARAFLTRKEKENE